MINLGKHTITSYVIRDDYTVVFGIDSNRAKVCEVTTREFGSIMVLSDVKHAMTTLEKANKSSYVFTEEHETVMSHLKRWQRRLTEDVDKTKSKLDLD